MENMHGYYLEDLKIGMQASYAKTITEADVVLFAGITGDDNPIHLNAEYAEQTMFEQRIVHGMFSAGLISAVLGTRMPGPGAIYIDQQLKFKAPVHIGDTVTATATVLEIDEQRRRVKLETICTVKGKRVAEGTATNMVDRRPV
ncbi:MaoC family dehydratase [Motiliproteus sp. MSK22-1]|uniref:MaoC family dehydratase n=1 Tax=Motiliproteus sp. MSK22-1 TaxID=1897630 RepID=UPI000978AC2E|nr:MaoC family dehydratase [Motiliproteus sp. MSK22-1]OMH27169.1 acyl dehydratase [Motiliproteus sp. MSK22-1]